MWLRAPLVILGLAGSFAFTGCPGWGPELPSLPDGGELPFDAGRVQQDGGIPDAGRTDGGRGDAGSLPFVDGHADEPCPEDGAVIEVEVPDGGVRRDLCIALRTVSGTALVDGRPASAPIQLFFNGSGFRSEVERPVDASGRYEARVMRERYASFRFRPLELHNHLGAKEVGAVDLREDATRDLAAKTWWLSGSAFLDGQPWPASTQPPDIRIHAGGSPTQEAFTSNVQGAWRVRLLEGGFQLRLSVPRAALGDTELVEHLLVPWMELRRDENLDVLLEGRELSGTFTIDGRPLGDRLVNQPDYRLHYIPESKQTVSVITSHEGAGADFKAMVPKGKYSIRIELNEATDPQLPSSATGLTLAAAVDLNANRTVHVNLRTHELEGALLVDGQPVPPSPGGTWHLYAQGLTDNGNRSSDLSWQVPLTRSAFLLKAFPGRYHLSLYLDAYLHPELAEGWLELSKSQAIYADVALPIDVQTRLAEGRLFIDGEPAASESTWVGTLLFRSNTGWLRKKVRTTDGTWRVKLPVGIYDVFFEINPEAFPEYAQGVHSLGRTVYATEDSKLDLHYRTVPVTGILRVGGEPVPGTLPREDEVALELTLKTSGTVRFYKSLPGGQETYRLRVPPGRYAVEFELRPGVLDGVAHGNAPLGNDLFVPE